MRLIAAALNLALMLAAAPVFTGALRVLTALRDREPPPAVFATFRLWRVLWHEEPVGPAGVTPFAGAAIALGLAAAILAASLIPTFTTALASAPLALLPLVVMLLALAAILPLLALMAAGTMAGGIAAGQILGFFCLASPALFLALWTLAQLDGGVMLSGLTVPGNLGAPLAPRLLAGLALAGIIRAAPAAAPIPDDTGRARMMALAAAALVRLAALSLIVALLFPFGLAGEGQGLAAWAIGLFAWLAKIAVATGLLAALRPGRPPATRLITPALVVATICATLAALLAEAPPI